MRLGVLSDIHVDLNGGAVVIEGLAAAMRRRGLEAMLIAGDVASDHRLTLRTLEELQQLAGVRVLFVPGNHDIWNEAQPGLTAWQAYDALLAFPGNLARGPLELPGGWSAVGDLGWYDYSFGGAQYAVEDFDRMQYGQRVWQDRIKAVWGRPTRDMHRWFLDRLRRQLEAVHRGPPGAVPSAELRQNVRVLMATHVLPRVELTVRRPDPMWAYLNAFLGSREYGELAISHGVRLYVCGHVHYRRQVEAGGTTFLCNCLGYAAEWADGGNPGAEIERALRTVELEG